MSIEVGSKLEGKVTGITHFGAFVELPEGVTGLVHISEIADNYVKDVNEFLKINDKVTVKVINVEKDGKIGLSIRKAQDRPARENKPSKSAKPHHSGDSDRPRSRRRSASFEDLMNRFQKDSEDRLTTLKKQDSKRGGRGGRRS
ncbi:S1 domain-containing RNA-binding protein [Caldalkalibacillus salinus]|uniref:S1 domain-containing RNA-binding protein n=1 Tax=Caldalkalibacillus salinus TaxID=2803787 RepID=UPI0019217401|nr:S1 domain-containing RNA-binding protein [Caldalkalibacillus salinus]